MSCLAKYISLHRLCKMMIYPSIILLLSFSFACGDRNPENSSVEVITGDSLQKKIFEHLLAVTENKIPATHLDDSLSFLLLPVHAICPYCRKKVIDSIAKYKEEIPPNQYIVISADGGKKLIGSYFKEQGQELPSTNRIFLDSTNLAFRYDLFDEKPTIYYTSNQRAIIKVASIPATVKQDLHTFFSPSGRPELWQRASNSDPN